MGHLFVCQTAAAMVDELTVLVCSTDAEPIPGQHRHAWMRELLPMQRIRHMHRNIPQQPADHPDFWTIWQKAAKEFHPEPIDRVFGSEPYILRLADVLQAEPVIIDPEREVFPVSGTAIRNNPALNWAHIPPAVRPYYQKRVCLLGPESVGKSTLAKSLSARFGTPYVPEYGRIYDAVYRQGENWQAADLVALAETHLALRQTLSRHGGPVLIEDTDAIQTAIWAEYLLGSIPPGLERLIAESDPAGLYLLLSPDVAWIDDGTRYSGAVDTREWFFDRCLSYLRGHGHRYVEISGDDWHGRSAAAVLHVEEFARNG